MSKSQKQQKPKTDAEGKPSDTGQDSKDQGKSKLTGNLILAGFCLYALILAVLTVDQIFGLGLYPPKLDRQLKQYIRNMGDETLSAELRKANADQVISYHEFSIPLLIDAIEKGDPKVKAPAQMCLQRIAQQFFGTDISAKINDPAALRAWYRDLRAKLDAAIPR